MIGENDFQDLQNFRYTDSNVSGVSGMTKINSSAPTNKKHRTGIQYDKTSPNENHLLIQSYNDNLNTSIIQQMTQVIPTTGNFAGTVYTISGVWTLSTAYSIGDVIFPTTYNGMYYECMISGTTDTTEPTWTTTEYARFTDGTATWVGRKGNLLGKFSKSPDGTVSYANGKQTLIYGGDEFRCAKFINYDTGSSFTYDYTDRINNDLSDTLNTAIIHPTVDGIDSNTSLLLHLNDDLVDASANTFTVTNVGAATFTHTVKFGTHALSLNGTTQYLTTPDDTAFDFSSGVWTIDGWYDTGALGATTHTLYFQGSIVSDGLNYLKIYVTSSGAVVLKIVVNGGTAFFLTTADGVITSASGYQHIEVSENGNDYRIFVGGTMYAYSISTVRPLDYTSVVTIGASALLDIGYSGGAGGAFTVGQVVTDVALGSTATIVANSGTILTVKNVNGKFVIGDQITDPISGDNLVDGNTVSTTCEDFWIGNLDELRISKACRHTGNFALMTSEYGSDSKTYAYIGSTLPGLTGIKFYINKVNASVGTPTIYYWDGTNWTTVGAVVDGTASGGKSMAVTGTMTFADLTELNKPKMVNNIYLYWLKIVWSALDNTTSTYRVTLKTVMQPAVDIWNGSVYPINGCQKYTSAGGYEDQLTQVLKQDATTVLVSAGTWDYPPETYLSAASFATTSYIYVGSIFRLTGLYFLLPNDQVNANVSSMYIEYWNGASWTTVGTLDDQTIGSSTSKSLNNSGYVMWNQISENSEYKTHVSTSTEYYYYRISFNSTLSANCKIDYIACIPTQKIISDYIFPIMWLNRLFYCGNKSKDKNKIIGSSVYSPTVFNGSDYIERYIGTNEEIVAGATLFSRYGTSISETLVITKQNETWILDGTRPEDITMYCVSKKYGCNAPHTMQVCDLGFEIAPGVNKAVLVWQSNNGIVMFDNGSIISVDQDIEDKFKNMFDTSYTTRLNGSYSNISSSFYDAINKEYHWLYAEGSSTIINRELVFDISKKKWYKVERGTYDLQMGLNVIDLLGNYYSYGAIDTGYIERLEYGNSMDGEAISLLLRTSDKPLYKSMMLETVVRHVKVVGVGKNSADKITIKHYIDTNLTPKTLPVTCNQNVVSTKRIYDTLNSGESTGTFHSFELSASVDDVTGVEPLAIGVLFKVSRYDTVGG